MNFDQMESDYLGFLDLLFIIEIFIVDGGLLVLLILGHQVVHVGLSLGELHFIHALAGVPMQESLGYIRV